jgi:hypothetical protein
LKGKRLSPYPGSWRTAVEYLEDSVTKASRRRENGVVVLYCLPASL